MQQVKKAWMSDPSFQNAEYAKSRESRRKCIVPSCKLRQENEEIQHWFLVPRCNIQTVVVRINSRMSRINSSSKFNFSFQRIQWESALSTPHKPYVLPLHGFICQIHFDPTKDFLQRKNGTNICFFRGRQGCLCLFPRFVI